MIVTRQRKKPFPWKRVLSWSIVLALVAFAFWWPPSRGVIADHTQPVWRPFSGPFTVMAQQKQIDAQTQQIAALQSQITAARAQIADRDKQIGDLQNKVANAQTQAMQSPSETPAPKATDAPALADLAAQATPEMRRTAAEWSAMDSEAAAKIVQQLPVSYVARVFAVMSPDAAGAILENLPASYAAQLTQERPELRITKTQ